MGCCFVDYERSFLSTHKMIRLLHWLVLPTGFLIVNWMDFTPRFGMDLMVVLSCFCFQQSDVHYSVLSLLLCLTDSPTNATYSPVNLNGSKVEG